MLIGVLHCCSVVIHLLVGILFECVDVVQGMFLEARFPTRISLQLELLACTRRCEAKLC